MAAQRFRTTIKKLPNQPLESHKRHKIMPRRLQSVVKRRYIPGRRGGGELLIQVADDKGGQEAEYRIEWSARLRPMMEEYAKHVSRPFEKIEFYWWGRRLTGEETPDLVDMDWEESITIVIKS